MLRLGITGGIGSGKSTVCEIFGRLGVPVYNADSRAKWLAENDPGLRQAITAEFGEESFKDGLYNRPYISSIVFGDARRLLALNDIIHPVVFADWADFCAKHSQHAYVIKEAAIMFETESARTVDKIVLVHAPEELRIARLMQRDGSDEAAIRQKMERQMPEEERLKLTELIIYNDNEHSLVEQVMALHKRILDGELGK